jgi:hypothetical protein
MDLRFQGSFRWRNDFFVETEYEVRVALVNRDTNMVVSRSGDLKCDLRTNPSVPSSRQADALVILQPGAKLKDGVAKFSVKIKSEACRSGMLYLVVSPPDTIEAGNAVSTSFDALQYKLKVAPFPMPHPCVFVQRDAKQRLELNISLQDSKDKIVTDCDVPLEFSVLKVFPSGEREVEEETDKFLTIQQSNNLLNKLHKGKAQVYVRLRELSNNHGGCVFIIGVHVNTNDRSESTSGIGSGMSSEVRVISRQSNSSSRKRKKQNQIVEVVEVEEKEEELSKHPAKKPHKCPPCPVPKQIGQDAIKCFQSDASSALNNVTRWASFAVQTLDKIQFELCGYGIGVHGLPDGAYHVRRCPWCFAYCESTHQQKHRKNCSLATMIRLYGLFSLSLSLSISVSLLSLSSVTLTRTYISISSLTHTLHTSGTEHTYRNPPKF